MLKSIPSVDADKIRPKWDWKEYQPSSTEAAFQLRIKSDQNGIESCFYNSMAYMVMYAIKSDQNGIESNNVDYVVKRLTEIKSDQNGIESCIMLLLRC